MFCNTNERSIAAAMAAWGLTGLMSFQIGPQPLAGTLQIALGDWKEEPMPVYIVHPEGRRTSAKVRAFVDLNVED